MSSLQAEIVLRPAKSRAAERKYYKRFQRPAPVRASVLKAMAQSELLLVAPKRDKYGQFGSHNVDFTPGMRSAFQSLSTDKPVGADGVVTHIQVAGEATAFSPLDMAAKVKGSVRLAAASAAARIEILFPGQLGYSSNTLESPVVIVDPKQWQQKTGGSGAYAVTDSYDGKSSKVYVNPSVLEPEGDYYSSYVPGKGVSGETPNGLDKFSIAVRKDQQQHQFSSVPAFKEAGKKSRSWPKVWEVMPALDYVLTHEFAHAITFNQMAKEVALTGKSFNDSTETYMQGIFSRYASITGNVLSWSNRSYSKYSAENKLEALAEAVVHVAGGGTDPVAIGIVKAMGGQVPDSLALAATRDRYGQFGTHNVDFTPHVFAGYRMATAADAARLKELKVPPAWRNVQLAIDPTAALQVRGQDSKGRHQRRYSAAHSDAQSVAKYARVRAFQKQIPKLDKALAVDGVTNPTAGAVALTRYFGIRPGSEGDTLGEHKAFGATNMLASQVTVVGTKVTFKFTGKHGVQVNLTADSPQVAKIITAHKKGKKPGDRLFPGVTEAKASAYVKQHTGPQFKTYDLRTSFGTAHAAALVKKMPRPTTLAAKKVAVRLVATKVAEVLGNTPTVALSSYISPEVFAAWD